MLEIVNDEKDIVKYHKIFHQQLEQILTERHESIIGFPGGARREKIFYSPILNMWYVSSEDVDGWKRIWNSFGIQNPNTTDNLNIAVEINFPFQRKGDVNGVFLKDENDDIYVGHRGLVNIGGRKKILNNYSELSAIFPCKDEKSNREVIVISPLFDDKLAWNIKVFVDNIKKIKEDYNKSNIAIDTPLLTEFTPEPTNRNPYFLNKIIEQNLEHGRIVNCLRLKLEKHISGIGNNKAVDLYIQNTEARCTHIFEVKSSSDSQSIYTAIGQLLFNSLSFNGNPEKIVVVPNSIDTIKRKRLNKLGFTLITYDSGNNDVKFYGLDSL